MVIIDVSGAFFFSSASHIGERVRQLQGEYDERILMWCKEETLDNGKKLTEVINEEHQNVKYLPGQIIPDNVVAVPDLRESVQGADILIFVIPHQFVKQTCETLKDQVKPSAFALTLIKVRSEHHGKRRRRSRCLLGILRRRTHQRTFSGLTNHRTDVEYSMPEHDGRSEHLSSRLGRWMNSSLLCS